MSRTIAEGRRSGASQDGTQRTCVGCRVQDSPSNLVRIYLDHADGHTVRVDEDRRAGGRGAWLHPREQCFSTAIARSVFNRAFRANGLETHELERWVEESQKSI